MAATDSSQKQIVILGGSYGGVSVAHNLLKHAIPQLPNKDAYQVTLVSASSQVFDRPASPRAMISDDLLPQDKLFLNIPKLFEQYPKGSFKFIHGKATKLDHVNRTVSVQLLDGTSDSITYYALLIATGSTTTSPLLGLNENEDVLRQNWATFRKGLSSAKSIVIVGGGPSGVESAGELGEHLNGRAGMLKSKLDNPKVPITLVTSASALLPILRPSLQKAAEGYLAKVGVTVIKNARVTSVSPQGAGSTDVASKATVTLEDGKTLEADLYIPATGVKYNSGFIAKELLTRDSRVDTNASTLRVDKAGPRVYAVGDIASYSRPAIHLITEAIPVVSANIKHDLLLDSGKEESQIKPERTYKEDKRETQLVPIGRSKGVGSAMGHAVPSILVWAIKGRDYWLWTTDSLWSGKQWAKEK